MNPRAGLEWIDRSECLDLLAGERVGRLAVIHGGTPLIFPVNYVLDNDHIVFRTDPGTKLTAGPRAGACFEIDRFDGDARRGWSVVARGRLEEVTPYDPKTWERVERLRLESWADGPKVHWMRLVPNTITGRRIGPRPVTGIVVGVDWSNT